MIDECRRALRPHLDNICCRPMDTNRGVLQQLSVVRGKHGKEHSRLQQLQEIARMLLDADADPRSTGEGLRDPLETAPGLPRRGSAFVCVFS